MEPGHLGWCSHGRRHRYDSNVLEHQHYRGKIQFQPRLAVDPLEQRGFLSGRHVVRRGFWGPFFDT